MRIPVAALGALLVVLASSLYGTVGILVPAAVATGFALPLLLALRYLSTAAVVHSLVMARGEHRTQRFGRPHVVALTVGLASILQSGLYFAALARVDVALVLALHFTFPAIVLVVEALLARRVPTRRQLVSTALALSGVALVVLGGGTQGADLLGMVFALGSGATCAGVVVVWSRVLRHLSPTTATAMQSTGLGVAWLTACVVLGTEVTVPGLQGLAWLAVVVVVCTVLPMILLAAGTARVGSVTASTLSTVEPVVGAVVAAIVLHQVPSLVTVLGAALIVFGSCVVVAPVPDPHAILIRVNRAVRPVRSAVRPVRHAVRPVRRAMRPVRRAMRPVRRAAVHLARSTDLVLAAGPSLPLPSSRPRHGRPQPTRPGERRPRQGSRVLTPTR